MRQLGLALLGFAAACGGAPATTSSVAGSSPPASATTTPASGVSATTICAVGGPAAGGPVSDPNGPYYHQVVLATSVDGVTLSGARVVIDHASVPDVVRLPDGSQRLYYVDGTSGAIGSARVDGDTVTTLGPLTMNGVRGPSGMADPDAVLLADGRIRLYYLNNFGTPGNGAVRGMCWADSTDGERFTTGGLAIQFSNAESVTDPSVARLPSGGWLMAASRGNTSLIARSPDGASFSGEESVPYGGVPELEVLPDGRVRLYVCAAGIVSYLSADQARTWTREATVVAPGALGAKVACDPSRAASANRFVFKIQP